MAEGPRLIDWMMCDDVRQELSGKISIMGIYDGEISVYSVPLMLPQLWFVLKWDISEGGFNDMIMRIELPDGKTLGSFNAKSQPTLTHKQVLLYLALFPFQVSAAGDYKLFVKIDDGQEFEMGKFVVKLAERKQ